MSGQLSPIVQNAVHRRLCNHYENNVKSTSDHGETQVNKGSKLPVLCLGISGWLSPAPDRVPLHAQLVVLMVSQQRNLQVHHTDMVNPDSMPFERLVNFPALHQCTGMSLCVGGKVVN